jgi:hypothetical protein
VAHAAPARREHHHRPLRCQLRHLVHEDADEKDVACLVVCA